MADVYKIGIEIALAGTIINGLEALSARLLGIHTRVGQIEGGFLRWGLAIGGAAAGLAGIGLFKGLDDAAKAGDDMLHAQAQLTLQGYDLIDVQRAVAAAFKTTADVQTAAASQVVTHLGEISYATGSMQTAIDIVTPLEKANAILNAMRASGTKGIENDEVFNLVKALEQKGLATPENRSAFLSYVDEMTKAVEASRGRVTPQSFQSAFLYGRQAMLGWDETFITTILPRLIQSWGGGGSGGGSGVRGPGNALMTAFSKIVQGQLSKTSKGELEDIGLGSMQPGGDFQVRGTEEFGKNPYQWVQDFLVPALKAHGISMSDNVAVAQEVSKLFGVRTASAVMTEFALQGSAALGMQASPFEKDVRLQQQALDLALAFDKLSNIDPFTVQSKLDAQLKSLGDAMAPLAEVRVQVLNTITGLVSSLAQFAAVNPDKVKLIGEGLLGLSAALTILGGVAVIAALAMFVPGGVAAVGIAALLATLATIAAFNWEDLRTKLTPIGEYFKSIGDKLNEKLGNLDDGSMIQKISMAMDNVATALGDGIKSIPRQVKGAITSMASDLGAKISAAFMGLFHLAAPVGDFLAGVPAPGAAIGAAPLAGLSSPTLPGAVPILPGVGSASPALSGVVAPSPLPRLDPGVLERSRRAQSEFQQNPEVYRGKAYGGEGATMMVPMNIMVRVNLDGRLMGEEVSREMGRMSTFPTQAPYSDSYKSWSSPDDNYLGN